MPLRALISPDVLDRALLGSTVERWLLLLAAVVLSFLVLGLLRRLVAWWLKRFREHANTTWEAVLVDVLEKTRGYFLFALALVVAAYLVGWNERGKTAVLGILTLAALLQSGRWGNSLITLWSHRYRERKLAHDAGSVTTIAALAFLARIVLWSVILLMVLDNVGVNVTTLVAGLGIGGIAVGLALQNVLGDLFASLSIVLDRPFVIGNMLAVDDVVGSVENVGLKSTRLRSLSGEQVIFSNAKLLDSRIRNYGRMLERRVVFELGIEYDTPAAQIETIPGVVRDIIEAREQVRFDRGHFKAHGDSALRFEFVYYVLSPDYNLYMDIHQAISFAIHRAFEEREIHFAFPTQTLYLRRADASAREEQGVSASAAEAR